MKMNRSRLSKPNTTVLRPLLDIFIFVIFISTCSKNPTESKPPVQEFSIQYAIQPGEEIVGNNIIIKADTITALVLYDYNPESNKYVTFNRLYNTPGTLSPSFAITDSLGVAKSIYKLVYVDELSSDSIISVNIDIGAGNDANSIAVHDTVNLLYVLQAKDPLSDIESFNFYPDNASTVNLASEGLEVSVIAKSGAGAGICNIPVMFELIGDNGSNPNGSIESEVVYTCDSNNSDEESDGNNSFGIASNQYTNINASIDYLIAKISDPFNDTLNLFIDTIKIETGNSTLLINDVASISSDASQSNITITDPDSIQTVTIYARALDAGGAIISGIPFNFSLDEDYNGAVYLSAGGSISNSLGDASSIVTINPALFSFENETQDFSSLDLQISITILSTMLSDNVSINISNNLPIGSAGNPSALFYSTINLLNFMPNNENIISSPEEEEDISIIVKDSLGGGLCNIPVSFRLEKVSPYPDIFGVISATSATTCDTANGSNIPGVAKIKYNNNTNSHRQNIVRVLFK